MLNYERFVATKRGYAALVIPFLLLCTVTVTAQSDLRTAVYGKTTTTKKPVPKIATRIVPKPAPTLRPKNTKTPVRVMSVPPRGTATVVSRRVASSQSSQSVRRKGSTNLLPVIFRTLEPAVEIWLNDKILGKTNSNLQLVKKLAPGEYRVVVRDSSKVLFNKEVRVSADQTVFNLFETPQPAGEEKSVETEKLAIKTEVEINQERSAKVKQIVDAYENPLTTDSVTLEDWQLVFRDAPLGYYQGNTAVQIEAQRWLASGQIEFAKKDYQNALTAYYKAAEFMPNSAYPFYELGNLYLVKGQAVDAIKFFQKAIKINGKLGMIYKRLGDAQRLLNKEKEALAAYELAPQFGYRTFETRYLLGLLRIQNKLLEKGIAELESLAKEDPRPDIHLRIGEAYERLKRDLPAIENYQKAIDLDPNSTIAHYRIGAALMSQREYPRAKQSLEKALALDPSGKVLDVKDTQKKLREIAVKANNNR